MKLTYTSLSAPQRNLIQALYEQRAAYSLTAATWRALRKTGWITPFPDCRLTPEAVKAYEYHLAWGNPTPAPKPEPKKVVVAGRKIEMRFLKKLKRLQKDAAVGLALMSREEEWV